MTAVTVLLVRHAETVADVWKRGNGKLTKLQKLDPPVSSSGYEQASSALQALVTGATTQQRKVALFSAPTKSCTSTALLLSTTGMAASEQVSFGLSLDDSCMPIVVVNGLCNGTPEVDIQGDALACIQKGYLPCAAAEYNSGSASPLMGVVNQEVKASVGTVDSAQPTQYLRFSNDDQRDPQLLEGLVAMTPVIDLSQSPDTTTDYTPTPKAKKDKTGKNPVFSQPMWDAGAKPALHMAATAARRAGCDTVLCIVPGSALQKLVDHARPDDYYDPPPALAVASFLADLHDEDESGRLITWKLHGAFARAEFVADPSILWPPHAGPVLPYGQVPAAPSLLDDAKQRALEEYRRKAKAEYNRANGIEESDKPPPAPVSSPASANQDKPKRKGLFRTKSSESDNKKAPPARSKSTSSADSSTGNKKVAVGIKASTHSATSNDDSAGKADKKKISRSTSVRSTDSGGVQKKVDKKKRAVPERTHSADDIIVGGGKSSNKKLPSSDHSDADIKANPRTLRKKNSRDELRSSSEHSISDVEDLLRDDSDDDVPRKKKSPKKDRKHKKRPDVSISSIAFEAAGEKPPPLERPKRQPVNRTVSSESLDSLLEVGKKLNDGSKRNISNHKDNKPGSNHKEQKKSGNFVVNIVDKIRVDASDSKKKTDSKKNKQRPPPPKQRESLQDSLKNLDQDSMKWLEQDLYSECSRSSESDSSSSADSDSFWSSVASSIAGNSVYDDGDSSVTNSVTASVSSDDENTEKKRTRRPMNFLKDMPRKPSFEAV